MNRPRVRSVTVVPRARPQRTPPSIAESMSKPLNPSPYWRPGLTLSELIGRLPTIGIDSGAIPGTRPDTSPINKR